MRKIFALACSLLFLVVAPGTVAGLVPWLIGGGRIQPAFLGLAIIRPVGAVLIVLDLIPLVGSFLRFALKGLGTPAPILPTKHLVVTGFYRHVRNPMYVGVVVIIVGEALLTGDRRLLAYAAAAWLAMHLFVVFYEEPKLHRTFGADYERFRANVPRWLPRVRAWES
jgi:protein-S-isoprenylcysteine O-methyltransferase Ste14